MQNRWNSDHAATLRSELALRVYSSRLLGEDESLVLSGGGNTSVKIRERNLLGEEEVILYVKLAAELCGALFATTTGLQIAVDGGNERVI